MNINYRSEIDKIKKRIRSYYNKQFSSDEEDYSENKRNKERIKKLIIQIYNDETLSEADSAYLITSGLELLAQYTGNADDEAIAEAILDSLFYEMKIINQEDIDKYYEQHSNRRWD